MNQDEEYLKLLSIFHYIVGGLAGLLALVPVIHLLIGLFLIFAPAQMSNNGQPPPAFIGWFFVIFSAAVIILGLALAASLITAGRFLAKRRNYTFCLVMAGVECIFMPFGTVLGVFTIIVLMRESVKQQFSGNNSPQTRPLPLVT